MVVDADVGDVGGHVPHRAAAPDPQEAPVARHIVLQDGTAVLETLGPLGPAAGRVAPGPSEDRGATGRIPRAVEIGDLAGGQI